MVNGILGLNINTLINYTLKMFDKSEEILDNSMKYMINKDIENAKQLSKQDDEIDDLRDYIRDRSIELMALKQPMAKDLRFIYALESMCLELERIGDYSVNIADEVVKIGEGEYIKELTYISKMKDICIDMIKCAKKALEDKDDQLAYEIALKDDLVDKLYDEVQECIFKIMNEKEIKIEQGVRILFIGRYLERIGDHATNICEKIIYALKGDMIEIG